MAVRQGSAPVRRTLKYLNEGNIVFRENVKIFTINYGKGAHHEGAKEFIFWKLCQIQYKNPDVQCLTFKNLTPSPFIRLFLEDGKSILIDLDSRSRIEIEKHLVNFTAVCKQPSEISHIKKAADRKLPVRNFGYGCTRHCICEVLGQVPCTSVVKVPKSWRGNDRYEKKFRIPPCFMEPGLEEEENED